MKKIFQTMLKKMKLLKRSRTAVEEKKRLKRASFFEGNKFFNKWLWFHHTLLNKIHAKPNVST